MTVSTHTISGIELFDVKHINRATIEDGNLLNTYVYEPLIQNEDILASAVGAKSEIKVYEGNSSVHKDLMMIYPSGGRGALAPITFNNENSDACLIKRPADDDAGKVLMAKKEAGFANYYEWTDLKFNTYSANITYNAEGEQTTSAMPSAYFDEILQKVKNNENVTIALTYDKIFPLDNSTQTYSLQASYTYDYSHPLVSTVSALEFSTIQKDYNTSVSKVIMLRAANSTDWQYSEESLAFDGNYVSAGNNQHLTMVTANALPETLQQNIIYII